MYFKIESLNSFFLEWLINALIFYIELLNYVLIN